MSHKIKEIRDRLNTVAADGTRFGLVKIDVAPAPVVQRRELTHSHVDGVIGRETDKEAIIQILMESDPQGDGDGHRSLCFIPIVGIGGLGKDHTCKVGVQ